MSLSPLLAQLPGGPGGGAPADLGGPLPIPDIAWSAIAPELVLFGVGILVLLLDTAGRQRLQASFVAMGVMLAGCGLVIVETDQLTLPALVGLGAVAQFALTFLWRDRPRMLSAILTGLGFAATLGVVAWQWVAYLGLVTDSSPEALPLIGSASLLADMVAVDGLALFTRVTICIAGLVTVPLGYAYLEERRIHRAEYYPLLLLSATGMTLLASAADFIMVFIAIEILSLSLYVLSGFAKRDLNSQESALKYFLLGSFSSALLLYGIAIVYGVTGSTNIASAGAALASLAVPQGLSLVGMALLLVGFAFKTTLVPFHMWTPDVYQGAPTPVTGFMAAATKAAAFAAFIRVFMGAFAPLQWTWVPVFSVLAVITMLLGAILTVVQRDLKRMLAYSAIAHAGYVLLAIVSVSRKGVSATLLYLLVYTFMTIGSFGILTLMERRGRKAVSLDDLRGVGRTEPLAAGLLALFLLSLAGIPGTAGFIAKFAVFTAAIEADQVALVVVALVSSAVAAYPYIRVIVTMFMEDVVDLAEGRPTLTPARTTVGIAVGLAFCAAATVAIGVQPGVLIDLARQAGTILS